MFVIILGSGFGVMFNDSSVIIGDFICEIVNIIMIEILCFMIFYDISNVSVKVVVRGEVVLMLNLFWYDFGKIFVVLLLSILEGSVSGGEQLMIYGIGFGFI